MADLLPLVAELRWLRRNSGANPKRIMRCPHLLAALQCNGRPREAIAAFEQCIRSLSLASRNVLLVAYGYVEGAIGSGLEDRRRLADAGRGWVQSTWVRHENDAIDELYLLLNSRIRLTAAQSSHSQHGHLADKQNDRTIVSLMHEKNHSSGHLWPLRVVAMSGDEVALSRMEQEARRYEAIIDPVFCGDAGHTADALSEGSVGGLIIDPFSTDTAAALSLVTWVRDRYREIGIALYGSRQELYEMPEVPSLWKRTLQHFWKMPKDVTDESFAVIFEDVLLLLFVYRLSGGKFGEQPGSIILSMMRPEVAGMWYFWHGVDV